MMGDLSVGVESCRMGAWSESVRFAIVASCLMCSAGEVRGHDEPCRCGTRSLTEYCGPGQSVRVDDTSPQPSALGLERLAGEIQFSQGSLGLYCVPSEAVERLANSSELASDGVLYGILSDPEQTVHVRAVTHVILVERHCVEMEKLRWICVAFSPETGPLSKQEVSRSTLGHWTAMWGVFLGIEDAQEQLVSRLSNGDVRFQRRLKSSRVVPLLSPSAGIYLCNVPEETLKPELRKLTGHDESFVIAHVLLTLASTGVRTSDADDSFFGLNLVVVEDDIGLSNVTIDESQRPRIESFWGEFGREGQ